MADIPGKERIKLLNRVKRIRGQMDAVERTLAENRNCADVLMLLAAVRGGINGADGGSPRRPRGACIYCRMGGCRLTPDLGEELIDLVRAYLK